MAWQQGAPSQRSMQASYPSNGSQQLQQIPPALVGNTRTLVQSHHIGILMEQLFSIKAQWERIARGLGYHTYEIEGIKATLSIMMQGPEGCLAEVLGQWMNWAAGDGRRSKDNATLEQLKIAVYLAGFPNVAYGLTLMDNRRGVTLDHNQEWTLPSPPLTDGMDWTPPHQPQPPSTGLVGSVPVGVAAPPQGGQQQHQEPPTTTVQQKREFSEDFSPDELHSWLRSNQVPAADCDKIKDGDVGGVLFKILVECDGWNDYAISKNGMLILTKHIKGKVVGDSALSSVAIGTPQSPEQNGSPANQDNGLIEKPPPGLREYFGTGTIDADGGGDKTIQFEAVDRGLYTPNLKLHDDDRKTTPIPPEPLRVPERDEYYTMKGSKHGVALIINNEHFASPNKDRKGTARDEHNLKETFLSLGYRPLIFRNLNEKEMMYIFSNLDYFLEDSNKKAQKKVDNDSFICCILSHGYKGGIITTDGKKVELDMIEKMTGKSEILRSKPKIFFVQACQGEGYGTNPVERIVSDSYTTSQRADFYLSFATVQGDQSYRDIYTGSWFVTEISKILCKFGRHNDLHELQLKINKSIANDPRYRVKVMGESYSQQPVGLNQLQKDVHFFLEYKP